jgi:protein-S-isoprenylcysteine O-methyltransferase Ste14
MFPCWLIEAPIDTRAIPCYLGLVCLNSSVTFFTGVLANVWSSIALIIWPHYAFVLPEEMFLRQKLAGTFDEYARSVPRWLLLLS